MDAKVILLVLLLALAGCAHSPIPIGLPCTVGPIIGDPGASKRWTVAEKQQILTLNRSGEILCDWKPPN